MSKRVDQEKQQAAVREAKSQGLSPSEAGVTTGASKQIDSKRGPDREGAPKGKPSHRSNEARGGE